MSSRTERRRGQQQRSQGLPLFPIAVGLILVVIVVAIIFTRNSGGEAGGEAKLSEQTAEVRVEGKSLPELPESGNDPAVGERAPVLSGTDFEGNEVSTAGPGKAKAVVFLAHWCPHCQAEVPELQDWIDANGMPSQVELFSVSTSVDSNAPNYPPSEWLERESWEVPVIRDDGQGTAARAFGLTGFPFFVFINPQGEVESRFAGEMPIEDFEARIEALS